MTRCFKIKCLYYHLINLVAWGMNYHISLWNFFRNRKRKQDNSFPKHYSPTENSLLLISVYMSFSLNLVIKEYLPDSSRQIFLFFTYNFYFYTLLRIQELIIESMQLYNHFYNVESQTTSSCFSIS